MTILSSPPTHVHVQVRRLQLQRSAALARAGVETLHPHRELDAGEDHEEPLRQLLVRLPPLGEGSREHHTARGAPTSRTPVRHEGVAPLPFKILKRCRHLLLLHPQLAQQLPYTLLCARARVITSTHTPTPLSVVVVLILLLPCDELCARGGDDDAY